MANSNYEMPGEMREFAERSVDQARKAFEGFVTVAQKAAGAVDGATQQAQSSAKTVSAQLLGFAEKNVSAAFELANKMVKVKDPQEAISVQSEFLKTQMSALQAQAKELGSVIQKSATPADK